MIDYIRKFDIELEREHYYAGETLKGSVVIENTENIRIRGECLYNTTLFHVSFWFLLCRCAGLSTR